MRNSGTVFVRNNWIKGGCYHTLATYTLPELIGKLCFFLVTLKIVDVNTENISDCFADYLS